jgi:hypothetical protein
MAGKKKSSARKPAKKRSPKESKAKEIGPPSLSPLAPRSIPIGPPPPPLTAAERTQVLSLPPLRKKSDERVVLERIEMLRHLFHATPWDETADSRRDRNTQASELQEVSKLAQALADGLGRLSDGARDRAGSIEFIRGEEKKFTLRTSNAELPALPRRDVLCVAYDASRMLASWAEEGARELRKPMKRRGPRRRFRDDAMAGWLADLWLECTDAGVAPRENDTNDWPFAEFVRAVARTVDKDFNGYRAIRRAYQLRKNLGITTARGRRGST